MDPTGKAATQEMAQAASTNTVNPTARDMVRVVQKWIDKAFKYADSMRWRILNAQAESDVRHGRVKHFNSPGDALKFLDGLD